MDPAQCVVDEQGLSEDDLEGHLDSRHLHLVGDDVEDLPEGLSSAFHRAGALAWRSSDQLDVFPLEVITGQLGVQATFAADDQLLHRAMDADPTGGEGL